jgi:hypothetical protein
MPNAATSTASLPANQPTIAPLAEADLPEAERVFRGSQKDEALRASLVIEVEPVEPTIGEVKLGLLA